MTAPQPLLLRPDNFTPPARTPWGGSKIVNNFKSFVHPAPDGGVGESWELSAGPEFASRDEGGRLLADAIGADPASWLGDGAARGCALLVKLLDADEPLSLQIHPSDDYPGLEDGEGGKPESWYVVDHEPGAALHLGFTPGVDRETVERTVEQGGDLSRLMQSVPVQVGDFVVLDAGTPHAVGAGITLVEPQRIVPGKVGVTYRYWDWNRRYDADGRPAEDGSPRALHLRHALAVTDFARATDPAALGRRRMSAGPPRPSEAARLQPLCGPAGDGALESDTLRVARLDGSGTTTLGDWRRLRALTVLSGSVDIGGLRVDAGHTAALPAALGSVRVDLDRAHGLVSAAT